MTAFNISVCSKNKKMQNSTKIGGKSETVREILHWTSKGQGKWNSKIASHSDYIYFYLQYQSYSYCLLSQNFGLKLKIELLTLRVDYLDIVLKHIIKSMNLHHKQISKLVTSLMNITFMSILSFQNFAIVFHSRHI